MDAMEIVPAIESAIGGCALIGVGLGNGVPNAGVGIDDTSSDDTDIRIDVDAA